MVEDDGENQAEERNISVRVVADLAGNTHYIKLVFQRTVFHEKDTVKVNVDTIVH